MREHDLARSVSSAQQRLQKLRTSLDAHDVGPGWEEVSGRLDSLAKVLKDLNERHRLERARMPLEEKPVSRLGKERGFDRAALGLAPSSADLGGRVADLHGIRGVSASRVNAGLGVLPSRSAGVLARGPGNRLALASVGAYISVYGLRKLAPSAGQIMPLEGTYYVSTGTPLHSVKNVLLASTKDATDLREQDLREIGAQLGRADVLGISSMTIDAGWTKQVIAAVREANPDCYIVWGGMHPIVCPEDAILFADAVCTGEGDFAFDELLSRMMSGEDFHDVRNFWFRRDGEIVRNDFRPLMTPTEMAERPHPQYAEEGREFIYERDRGFVPLALEHYLACNSLSYHTIWTQGCPYRCTYCGNTAFLAIDKKYASIRQTPVSYIIEEVKRAVAKHPHINTVVFDDDCMAALPVPVLREFSKRWREEIGIPFFVAGVIPAFVQREKLEILLEAGMNRLRMGIQSGSDRMLKFFKRPNKPGLIGNVTKTISDYRGFMIPPAYDIIVDIPVEQKEDVEATIRLVYDMPRPFTLSVFSLRLIPGTDLEKQIKAAIAAGELEMEGINKNYKAVAPTMANALLFLTAAVRMPRWLFEYLLRFAKPSHEPQRRVPLLLFLCRGALFMRRGLSHLRFMDFSVLPGRVGYFFWRIGAIGFWQRHFVRRFQVGRHSMAARTEEIRLPAPRTFSTTG
jgi:anaerobic magnesium-protoporphyrin IX monomethyl ester cyclase